MVRPPLSFLLLDPHRAYAGAFRAVLEPLGYHLEECRTDEAACEAVRRRLPHIVFKPARPERRGTGVMERIHRLCADITFIFLQPQPDVTAVMRAIRRGAFDCLPLPCPPAQLVDAVHRALEHQRLAAEDDRLLAPLAARTDPEPFSGKSAALREVRDIIRQVAATDATVLIQGETGTGKELAARLLHRNSRRAEGPFVAVNCASLPDSLIESEFFGHVRGAFTGAIADKPGRFALASGGTLFLDEIGDLSPMGQADLLRVLEDGMFRPVGSAVMVWADARIVAATNHDLPAACRAGRFREDLLHRLAVIPLRLPALRERPEDIADLATRFVRHFCARHRRPVKRLSPASLRVLRSQAWPGNIRELRNVIERVVLLTPDRTLEPRHFPLPPPDEQHPAPSTAEPAFTTLREAQRLFVRQTLSRCGGNKSEAARRLDISRRSLYAWTAEESTAPPRGAAPSRKGKTAR